MSLSETVRKIAKSVHNMGDRSVDHFNTLSPEHQHILIHGSIKEIEDLMGILKKADIYRNPKDRYINRDFEELCSDLRGWTNRNS